MSDLAELFGVRRCISVTAKCMSKYRRC